MSPGLGILLQPHMKQPVTLRQALNLLSDYLLLRRNKLFDVRNIHVALLSSDPLSKSLGVLAFHQSQSATILMNKLTPHINGVESYPVSTRTRAAQHKRYRPTPYPYYKVV